MQPNKQLIRRYLVATAVGLVVGLGGVVAEYELFLKQFGYSASEVDRLA